MPSAESSSLATANSDGAANRRGASTANGWSVAFRRAVADGHPAVRDFLLGGARTEALGSNNWVVDGTMTASGKPLLANDPHLGTHIPSLWYLAHISGGGLRRHRRHPARARPRSRSAAIATSRGARPTWPPTSRISISKSSTHRDARHSSRSDSSRCAAVRGDHGEGR